MLEAVLLLRLSERLLYFIINVLMLTQCQVSTQ